MRVTLDQITCPIGQRYEVRTWGVDRVDPVDHDDCIYFDGGDNYSKKKRKEEKKNMAERIGGQHGEWLCVWWRECEENPKDVGLNYLEDWYLIDRGMTRDEKSQTEVVERVVRV